MSPVNDIVSPDPENIYKLRDFAADTLTKNGVDEILSDPENIFDFRDFAADALLKNGNDTHFSLNTLSDQTLKSPEIIFELNDFAADTLEKNGTEAKFTTDTLSDPNLNNNLLENMAIFVPDVRETYLCIWNSKIESYDCPLFLKYFMKNKIFKFLISPNFDKYSQNIILFVRSDLFWSWTGLSHVISNLGGRGHRFNMTLESHISRFKLLF